MPLGLAERQASHFSVLYNCLAIDQHTVRSRKATDGWSGHESDPCNGFRIIVRKAHKWLVIVSFFKRTPMNYLVYGTFGLAFLGVGTLLWIASSLNKLTDPKYLLEVEGLANQIEQS